MEVLSSSELHAGDIHHTNSLVFEHRILFQNQRNNLVITITSSRLPTYHQDEALFCPETRMEIMAIIPLAVRFVPLCKL